MDTTINNNKLNVAIIVLQEPAWGSNVVVEFQTAHYHLLALTFPIWRKGAKSARLHGSKTALMNCSDGDRDAFLFLLSKNNRCFRFIHSSDGLAEETDKSRGIRNLVSLFFPCR